MRAPLTNIEQIRHFVYAGDAVFTLVGQASRFTYKVQASDNAPGLYFVRVLTGPDIWTYAGIIRNQQFSTTAKSTIGPTAPSARALVWFLDRLPSTKGFGAMQFWHEGKCCRCGRALTDPESIAKGIGPVCEGMS